MNELAARKRLLLAENEECRRRLAHELERLRPAVDWVDHGISIAKQARSWLSLLGPVAGLFTRPKEEEGEGSGRWLRFGRRMVSAWLRR